MGNWLIRIGELVGNMCCSHARITGTTHISNEAFNRDRPKTGGTQLSRRLWDPRHSQMIAYSLNGVKGLDILSPLLYIVSMVTELTNQQFAAIQYPNCPQCGYRMQLLMANSAVRQFACYRHDEPYYKNEHSGIKYDPQTGLIR